MDTPTKARKDLTVKNGEVVKGGLVGSSPTTEERFERNFGPTDEA